jgi:hypothetical protein
MVCVWNLKADTLVDHRGRFDPAKARRRSPTAGAEQVGRPSDAAGGRNARRRPS